MATIRLIPSTYYLSNTNYMTISDESNMYANTDSTNYATVTHTRGSTTSYYIYVRGFNFTAIPENATVDSFTVKLKASETGVNTGTNYVPRLCNDTTTINGSFSALGTSASVKTCTGITADFDTIKNYGSNFGIRINTRRASSGTQSYAYIYGAEIEIEYHLPTLYTKASGSWQSISTGYEKVSGAWSEKEAATLFQSGYAYRKGN